MRNETKQKLHKLALKRSIPFCYDCYKEAPRGQCGICGSEDLMRLLPGVGRAYGTEWMVSYILAQELPMAEFVRDFSKSVGGQIGGEIDGVNWWLALGQYLAQEKAKGNLCTFGSSGALYYTAHVEDLAAGVP